MTWGEKKSWKKDSAHQCVKLVSILFLRVDKRVPFITVKIE